MKTAFVFAVVALLAHNSFVASEDGKYRPTEITTRIVPTTTRILTTPTARPCQLPYDRCDSYDNRRNPGYYPYDQRHHEPRLDRFPTWNRTYPEINDRYPSYTPRHDTRYDSRFDSRSSWDRRTPTRHFYDRPIRLEERIEENGYSYKYETRDGLIAEEKGVIESLNVRTAFNPVKVQGFVSIKDYGTEIFRMDYTVATRDPDFARRLPRGHDEQRVPTAIARALELMETHA